MDKRFRMLLHPPHSAAGSFVSPENVSAVRAFHSGMPGYRETPLYPLPGLAAHLGAAQVLVKDESRRFGQNAFKALGAGYAIGRLLCERAGIPPDQNAFQALRSPQYASLLQKTTFATATDGNHGRGVAWAAGLLGCGARVYLPFGSSAERLMNIRALGALAEITSLNYDDTVRLAAKDARDNHWTLVQDTSWPGYESIPRSIMQGYTTLGQEIAEQLDFLGSPPPTHLFLQAGVGSFAGALSGFFAGLWREACPRIIVVEPASADCLYQTAAAGDGRLHAVSGPMNSMMAGLCCGEPCPLAWEILDRTAGAFIACGDGFSADGMRLLGRPAAGDPAIVSGESGAVTAGVAAALFRDPALKEYKAMLGLDSRSRVLLINTEGDTDRGNYRRILAMP